METMSKNDEDDGGSEGYCSMRMMMIEEGCNGEKDREEDGNEMKHLIN
jgi:hypothetical protein